MAALKYQDEHNKVGFLEKPKGSADYHEVLDFLRSSHIRYAISHDPLIYDSLVKQFWSTASLETFEEGPPAIIATIDSTPYTITESLVRSQLQLDDEGGVEDLPIADIYLGMDNMGYPSEGKLTFHKNKFSPQWRFIVHTIMHCLSTKSGSWDQFGSSLATAFICLTEGRRFNWSNYIFKGMVNNITNPKKFLMFPRFLQMILNIETRNTKLYHAFKLTSKMFANMRLNFHGDHMPLLATMLPPAQPAIAGESSGEAEPSNPQTVPETITEPDHSHDQAFTPPRPTTTTASAPENEQGPSSDPNPASSSRPPASEPEQFTSTHVEDDTMGGSFDISPPRTTQAPPEGTTSGGAEDPDKLTALSSLVDSLVQKPFDNKGKSPLSEEGPPPVREEHLGQRGRQVRIKKLAAIVRMYETSNELEREREEMLVTQKPSEFSSQPTVPSAEPRTHSYGTRRKSLVSLGMKSFYLEFGLTADDRLGVVNALYFMYKSSKYFTYLREILYLVDRKDLFKLYGIVVPYYEEHPLAGFDQHNGLSELEFIFRFSGVQVLETIYGKILPRLDADCLVADSTHMKVVFGVGFKMIAVPSSGVFNERYIYKLEVNCIKVPAGRYVVPTGKDKFIVSAADTNVISLELLSPKKQGRDQSSSSTSALPQDFEIGESSRNTSVEHHEEQIEEILNHLDKLFLDPELQQARAQITKLQRKQMGSNHKISLARFRITELEHIINDIQVRHQADKESLLDAINELKNHREGPSD
ncbi:hypothetical protein Tco_1125291 [Tanacetum coccineum]|uniref:Synaptobrevin, longin-like domain protein n=1 Tax=Tanacetum coccineum TaxID=301880 RepID=A0ABQ5J8L2_9ASTR